MAFAWECILVREPEYDDIDPLFTLTGEAPYYYDQWPGVPLIRDNFSSGGIIISLIIAAQSTAWDCRQNVIGRFMRIAFFASPKSAAQQALRQMTARYGQCDLADADHVVAIGGDGTVLKALHTVVAGTRQPVFAMRVAGSLGILANPFDLHGLHERLRVARRLSLCPLKAETEHGAGSATVFAINEIVLIRQRLQAAKLRVTARPDSFAPLIGDGLLVATPIGSSGYNRSVGGPGLPHGSSLLALTALAPHHRSEWRNIVLSDEAVIQVEVVNPDHRPVELQTSMRELTNIRRARISSSRDLRLTLLFDATRELPGGLPDPHQDI
jgi:NAD+ kinase